MANEKRNQKSSSERPGKRRRGSGFLQFPQVKGKVVSLVELDPHASAVVILFEDGLALSFDLDCSVAVFPELSRRKSGNWTPLRKWKPVASPLSIVKW
jgi:hypothetical protein